MLKTQDSEVWNAIDSELRRQQDGLEMIPSENYASKAVLEALGSVMTNKYSEGYPGKRYYGGNEFIDVVERLAIERAKKLFGAEHANVQPYSGSPANIEIYFALLKFGDKVMGLNLAHGGHLTHGHPVNFSGKAYQFVQYGVDKETEQLDYEAIRELAIKEKPKLIISGYTAYPRTIDFKKFSEIAEEVGAISMVDMSHISGLIAGGVHPSPFPFTDVVMTTTHKTLRGPRGAIILCKEKFAQQIDKAVFPGMQGGPHDNNTAAKAVALGEAMKPEFKIYAQQIVKNSKTLAKELQKYGFRLVSGGTDNHLILVDLQNKNVTGKEAEAALDKARITVNKNMVPFDTRSPFDPSGIRLGTPAITSRGMKEEEMKQIASFMDDAIIHFRDEQKLKSIAEEVTRLTKKFPLYE
ncbi:MAG TPA: serine hydroxymethyltransferase [Candidatus Nanoarchaeia archaeon]|nr:serine hydroxymethyltransferase [Candidatus Nanoarchaeia archaeon]